MGATTRQSCSTRLCTQALTGSLGTATATAIAPVCFTVLTGQGAGMLGLMAGK